MNREQMIQIAVRVMIEDYYTETPEARRGRALGYTGLEHVRGCGSDDPDAHLCLPEHWAQCACFVQGCAVVDALVAAGCVPSDTLTQAAEALIGPAEDALRYLTCDDKRFGMTPPTYTVYREVWDALRDALTGVQSALRDARGVSATPEATT